MSDVVWYGIAVILFAGSLACLFYSGWQVFAPWRYRRIHVIYTASQRFRAEANVWYWRTVFLLATVSCVGIVGALASRKLATFGAIIILVGDALALIGGIIVAYYEHQARNARHRELETAAVR